MDAKRNPKDPQKGDEFQWSKVSRTLVVWVIFFMFIVWIVTQMNAGQQGVENITYDRFITLLENNKITAVEIADRKLTGELVEEENTGGRVFSKIQVMLPNSLELENADNWLKNYVQKIEFKEKELDWGDYLLNLVPWILIAGIWLFVLRRMQGGNGGARSIFNFGRSKAKLLTENRPRVTFDDVAGADEAKTELREIIEFLKEPEKFQKLGGRIPKGALLLGPPGTGKTLLAKAVAGEAGVAFFSMSGADFVEMFVGVGASRVRDLFEQGKKNAPCIIFIDEIDAVGRHRGAGLGGGHDEREQTLNQLLVEMDGFESNEGVILIAATNRPDVLDVALLRPGRFDRQIIVDRPDVRGREGILKVHTRNIAVSRDVDLKVLAQGTPGFSGADLANIVNEAALLAARKNKRIVDMTDFEEAKDKEMMGAERKSMIISDEEKKVVAYHEAGHALVAKIIPGSDPVHKATIIPRGRALGMVTRLPEKDRLNMSKGKLAADIVVAMGGREAEKLILKECTTGAASDLEHATNIARKMVCEWGMSDEVGPLTFGKKDEEIFLGREIAQHRDYSEMTAQIIDNEVKKIVIASTEKARKILRENVDALHRVAQSLLAREIITGDELDQLVNGEELAPKKQVNGIPKPIKKSENKPSNTDAGTATDNPSEQSNEQND